MGAGQSVPPELYEKQITVLTEQLAQQIKKDNSYKCLWDKPVQGHLIFEKRTDGSSIKEIYIPLWGVVFFESGGLINIRSENRHPNGKSINISEADATLLHNLHTKQKAAIEASDLAMASFFKYIGFPSEKI